MKYALLFLVFLSVINNLLGQTKSTIPELPQSQDVIKIHQKEKLKLPYITEKLRSDPNFIARPGQVYYDRADDEYWFMLNGEWIKALASDRSDILKSEEILETREAQESSAIAAGNVGIGNPNPSYPLDISGAVRIDGDFINQEILGAHSDVLQSIPFTNAVFVPLTNTIVSVTIDDNIEGNNSSVLLTGFARVFGGNLGGTSSSLGQYFIILQKDIDPNFTTPIIVTYTTDICYLVTPNGIGQAAIGFGGGGHVSYVDSNLDPGTYYYRLVFYANGIGINSGTYDIYQRDLNLLQIKN